VIRILYRPARFIYRRFFRGSTSASSQALAGELIALHRGRKSAPEDYMIEKIAQSLLLLMVLLVICLITVILSLTQSRNIPGGRLKRNDYGEGERSVELSADIEAESEAIVVPVIYGARRYGKAKVMELLTQARDILDEEMTGTNPSADHVETDLFFPETMMDGHVAVSYMTVPYGIISETGKLTGTPAEEGSLVEIQATLSCQEETLVFEKAVMVFPPVLSGKQLLQRELVKELESANEEQAESEFLELPGEVAGRRIDWSLPASGSWRIALAWLLVLPPLFWFGRDESIHAKARTRQEQLALDFPDVLWNMTMLLGAGMSVRQAFSRVASNYEKAESEKKMRYVGEEMRCTLREMETGTGEAAAYENFGRRCGLPGYIKLGSLLTTSVRKGTADLRQTLEKEAALALEERKNMALRAGERAATKMLFPMILMLGVVIVILIVPAFMSMA